MNIPPQLQNEAFGFVKLKPASKQPYESNWQNNPYSWKVVAEYLQQGGNYGVMGGGGHLVIIDSDHPELDEYLAMTLPETFTVKTPGKGRHRYFLVPEVESVEKIVLTRTDDDTSEKVHYGEVQGKGSQVVGPGSIHPDTKKPYTVDKDVLIAKISLGDLLKAIEPFRDVPDKDDDLPQDYFDSFNLDITDVLAHYNVSLNQSGQRLIGPHPIHGSSTGSNFVVTPSKNAWHCFRCSSGGGPLLLVALLEKELDCEQCTRGALRGEFFKKIARVAETAFDIKIIQTNELGRLLKSKELALLKEQITHIDAHLPKEELPLALEPILEKLARIDEAQADAILSETIRPHFGITSEKQMAPYANKLKAKRKALKTSQETPLLSSNEALNELKNLEDEVVLHPAIDFQDNQMYFGIKIRGQQFIVSPDGKLKSCDEIGWVQ